MLFSHFFSQHVSLPFSSFFVFKDEGVILSFFFNNFYIHISKFFSIQLLILCIILTQFLSSPSDNLNQHWFICALFHFFQQVSPQKAWLISSHHFFPLSYSNQNSTTLVSFLHKLFARFGLPETIMSDNGTVFFKRFRKFL